MNDNLKMLRHNSSMQQRRLCLIDCTAPRLMTAYCYQYFVVWLTGQRFDQ